jgi:hypothetical protein
VDNWQHKRFGSDFLQLFLLCFRQGVQITITKIIQGFDRHHGVVLFPVNGAGGGHGDGQTDFVAAVNDGQQINKIFGFRSLCDDGGFGAGQIEQGGDVYKSVRSLVGLTNPSQLQAAKEG